MRCILFLLLNYMKKKTQVKEEVKLINEEDKVFLVLLFVLILNSWVDNLILANVKDLFNRITFNP